jgi:O-antigen/teichoic acid export membrane protein
MQKKSSEDAFVLDRLARTVTEVESNFKDPLEVAVVLEILGYSDKYAQDLGYRDLFHLAEALFLTVKHYGWNNPDDIRIPPKPPVPHNIKLFFMGMFYHLGWMIMLIALFLGGQSLWAAKNIPVGVSTAIGLGVLLGLVSTGGIQQFSAWKLMYYYGQNNKPLTQFIMKKNLVYGAVIILFTAGLILLLNHYVIRLPLTLIGLTIFYMSMIGIYRLFITPVFAFKKYIELITCSVGALVIMFVSYYALLYLGYENTLAVIYSQTIGLVALIAVSGYFAYLFIVAKREEKDADEPEFYARPHEPTKVKEPRTSILVFEGIPFFLYGTLYFVFLFGDRLISWLGPGDFGLNYNRSYQIGVDVALLMLIPITGVKFAYLFKLSDYLEKVLRGTKLTEPDKLRDKFLEFYRKMMERVIFFGILFLLLAFFFAGFLIAYATGTAESVVVFRWALLGILFFAIFLGNAVFSFSFRRNKSIAVVLAVGCVLNYILSYSFSTMFISWYAVFGFVVSAAFLAGGSTVTTYLALRKADWTYYSAF